MEQERKVQKVQVAKRDDNTLAGIIITYQNKDIDDEIIYREDDMSEVEFKKIVNSKLRELKVTQDQLRSITLAKLNKVLENAVDEDQEIYQVNYDYENLKGKKFSLKKKTIAKVVVGGIIVGSTVALVSCGSEGKADEQAVVQETTIETPVEEEVEVGYGIYSFDLTDYDLEKYSSEIIPESAQKANTLNYYNILSNLNQSKKITVSVDEKTRDKTIEEVVCGLTVEQLIALDAYCNSNVYEEKDYIENFGLYDFSNVSNDFEKAATTLGAYLSDKEVDGEIIADIFKDEVVKEKFEEYNEYRLKVLNAETNKEAKKYFKEYQEYLQDVAIDMTSNDYVDFSEHPGMALITTVFATAYEYNNFTLSGDDLSRIIITGDEDLQSKLNSICASANEKIDEAEKLVDEINHAYYNDEKHPIIDEIIKDRLCDENQIIDIINKELEKTNQLVTEEDQNLVIKSAIINSQEISLDKENDPLKSGSKTETKVQQTLTEEQVAEGIKTNPEAFQDAKDQANKEQGTISYETPEEKEEVDEQIKEDIEETYEEGVDYANQVVAYYELHGDTGPGIPPELQAAYDNLGSDIFNTLKNTGIARYMTNEQNKESGGEYHPEPGVDQIVIIDQPQDPTPSIDNTTNSQGGNIPSAEDISNQTGIPIEDIEIVDGNKPSSQDGSEGNNDSNTTEDKNDETVTVPETDTKPEDNGSDSSNTDAEEDKSPVEEEKTENNQQETIPENNVPSEENIANDLGVEVEDVEIVVDENTDSKTENNNSESTNSENNITPGNNQDVSGQLPSDIILDDAFSDVVIEDFEIEPVYSLESIYGIDEYSDFDYTYSDDYTVSGGDAVKRK